MMYLTLPSFRGIDIQHSSEYTPDMTQKPAEPPMVGPKLPNIESSHNYGPVPPRRGPMTEVQGPVYGVEGANQYNIVKERVPGELTMAGPKYNVQDKSQYFPQTEKVPGELAMCGPVWQVTIELKVCFM